MQKTNNNSEKMTQQRSKNATSVYRRQVKHSTRKPIMVDSLSRRTTPRIHSRGTNTITDVQSDMNMDVMAKQNAMVTEEYIPESKMEQMAENSESVNMQMDGIMDSPIREILTTEAMMNEMQGMPEGARIHNEMEMMSEAQMMEEPQMTEAQMVEEPQMAEAPQIVEEQPVMSEYPILEESSVPEEMSVEQIEIHPIHHVANTRMKRRQMTSQTSASRVSPYSAKELKERAIQKALASASSTASMEEPMKNKAKSKKTGGMHFGFGRVILALSCAAAAVFAIAYFVNINMPDISLKVAAMQTGINASYPSYVPRDYIVSSITSEEGKVLVVFKNTKSNTEFTLVEEVSSWDSNALLTNYVKDAFDDNYSTIREQGLTIYVDGSDAAWVNGGIVYKIKAENGVLTNKQIRSIATSL